MAQRLILREVLKQTKYERQIKVRKVLLGNLKIFIWKVSFEIEVQRAQFSEPEQLAMNFVTAPPGRILKRIL